MDTIYVYILSLRALMQVCVHCIAVMELSQIWVVAILTIGEALAQSHHWAEHEARKVSEAMYTWQQYTTIQIAAELHLSAVGDQAK